MFDIKLETKKFIKKFVSQYEESDKGMKGEELYQRMIYECDNYRILPTRTKLYKTLREEGFEFYKKMGILNFCVKRIKVKYE